MSASASVDTGKKYGVERVCHVWNISRSTYYSQLKRGDGEQRKPMMRGPKPKVADDDLLVAIKKDLERTPWIGEGYRKVWARLRVLDEIRVGGKRVLRLMRENKLLSPHRSRPNEKIVHDGRITTDAPNVMWGTDGARVLTAEEGWVWLFATVDHWNAECVGWHVCKYGTRFAAVEPISMALTTYYGGVGKQVANGLKLRMDHGSQFLSDHYQKQIEYWGVKPSFAFVAQPETNGVAERFNRTFKEQIIHGRIHKNVAELRKAVRTFVKQYNEEWLIEKNGFKSPSQIRQEWNKEHALPEAA